MKKTYGPGRERRTVVSSFDRVAAAQVIIANEILYLDAKEGFAGTGLKKEGEPICKCSNLDDILFFTKDGSMTVSKVAPKIHVGKNPLYINLYKKDEDAVYTLIYRDGKNGPVMAKRFRIGGTTRDKQYVLTKGTPGTMVLFFARHETEEESNAQNLLVHLKPALYLRTMSLKFPIAALAIKGRDSLGNVVTKHAVDRIVNERKSAEA